MVFNNRYFEVPTDQLHEMDHMLNYVALMLRNYETFSRFLLAFESQIRKQVDSQLQAQLQIEDNEDLVQEFQDGPKVGGSAKSGKRLASAQEVTVAAAGMRNKTGELGSIYVTLNERYVAFCVCLFCFVRLSMIACTWPLRCQRYFCPLPSLSLTDLVCWLLLTLYS